GAAVHAGNAGAGLRKANALRLDKGAEDGERQLRMPAFDTLVEPVRQLALARQRAIPFAVVIDDATNLPERQFEIDQRQRRIGPGTRLDQSIEARDLLALAERRISAACRGDDFGHQSRVGFAGLAEPNRQRAEVFFSLLQHGFVPLEAAADSAGHLSRVVKTSFENEMRWRSTL